MISLGYCWELLSNGRSLEQLPKPLFWFYPDLCGVGGIGLCFIQVTIEEGNFFVLFDDNLFKYMLK